MTSKIEDLKREDMFLTFDLGLATALVSTGFEIVSIDKANRSKAQFLINRSNGIDETVQAYWNGKLPVDARTFFDNQKMLKNRLYSS